MKTLLISVFLFFVGHHLLVAQKSPLLLWEEMDSLSSLYLNNQDPNKATFYGQKAIETAKEISDSLHGVALRNFGYICEAIGDTKTALSSYKQAVDVHKKSLGKDHIEYLTSLDYLAYSYTSIGQFELALPIYLDIQTLQKKNNHPPDQVYMESLHSLSMLYYMTDEYKKAEDAFVELLDLTSTYLGPSNPKHLGTLNNLGALYKTTGQYVKSEKLLLSALKENKNDFTILGNLTDLYSIIGDYETAESYSLQYLALTKQKFGQHPKTAAALSSLAGIYREIGRYQEAEALYLQKIEILAQAIGRHEPQYGIALNSLAMLYDFMEEYGKAEKLYWEASNIFTKNPNTSANSTQTFNNLAALYEDMKQYDKAEKLYLKIISETNPSSKHWGTYNNNLGYLYTKMNRYQEAEACYLKTIASFKQRFGHRHPDIAKTLNNLSHVKLNNQEFDEAFSLNYQAFGANSKIDLDSQLLATNIHKIALEHDFLSSEIAMSAFFSRANLMEELYLKDKNLSDLIEAYTILQAACSYIQRTLNGLSKKSDKIRILDYMTSAAADAIRIAHQLHQLTQEQQYLEEAITFAEYNKSAILSSALNEEAALNFGEVPDSLIQEEAFLKKELSLLDKKLKRAEQTKDSAQISRIQEHLVEIHLEQDALKKFLIKEYPKFTALKSQHSKVETKEIQEKLLNDQSALLEYFVYDSTTFLILITNKSVELYPLGILPGELNKAIAEFRKGLSNYSFIVKNPKEAFSLYTNSAFYFYQKLITPALQELKNIKQLIVVTDAQIGHIPFEALLTKNIAQTEAHSYTNLPYLIHDFRISYSYSASLLLENKKQRQGQNNKKIAAFGAAYPKLDTINATSFGNRAPLQQKIRASLSPLEAVNDEIEGLKKLFPNGLYLYGNEANESNFKRTAGDYAIVHLAMHGILNQRHPLLSSMAFTENQDTTEDNFLEAHEISHLQLHNDLVVLSACETGYGKFEQGEGVLSLARSFMYAGVPSLVVSLWQVNDNSTAIIMEKFYANLNNGLAKDEALRQAKLDYLKVAKNIAAHPAFWSAFIQIGDASPIQLEQGAKVWIWGLLALFCLGALAIFVSRRAKA